MKFGYVCTNFNNSQFTLDAVHSLLATRAAIRIAVIDNDSQASAKDLLRSALGADPRVHLVFNESNLGYFRGLNVGIRLLRQFDPDIQWMIVGNNDLMFPSSFCSDIEQNVELLSKYAVIAPDVVTLDGEHQNPHVISAISPIREIFYDLYYSNYALGCAVLFMAQKFKRVSDRSDEDQWEVAQTIYQGHGSCYLLTPRFFAKFEELWAPTFLMSEEFFLSKQLSDAAERMFYTPAIRVTHHWHATLSKLPGKKRWAMARDAHKEYRKYVGIFGRNTVAKK